MDLEKIKEFIQLAKEENVTTLKYEEDDVKISVSFDTHGISIPVTQAIAPVNVTAETPSSKVVETTAYHEITSPFVGTFYSSPAPGKDNFISVGQKVSKGTTLCILEAMKIMNEIESDINGEIVEICVDNESLVEFGQVLFKIKA
jgi:acetyl-CoA carboxylase biotin carboxyl carrier protein